MSRASNFSCITFIGARCIVITVARPSMAAQCRAHGDKSQIREWRERFATFEARVTSLEAFSDSDTNCVASFAPQAAPSSLQQTAALRIDYLHDTRIILLDRRVDCVAFTLVSLVSFLFPRRVAFAIAAHHKRRVPFLRPRSPDLSRCLANSASSDHIAFHLFASLARALPASHGAISRNSRP